MKANELQPTVGRLIVKPLPDSDKVGRIYIPATAQKQSGNIGTVIAVSQDSGTTVTGEWSETPRFTVGQTLIFGQYTGVELKIERDTFIVLNEADVLCVVPIQSDV